MNKVYLSGIIAREPLYRVEAGNVPHLILFLGIRYTTKSGTVNREAYRVSVWHETAQWGASHLKAGQIVVVQGHLVRRKRKDDVMLTEVAADEIVAVRQTTNVHAAASPDNGGPTDENVLTTSIRDAWQDNVPV